MKTILGIDQISDYHTFFQNKRIGLITNYSGVDSKWRDNIDVFMQKGYTIVKIYTPEHGLYGSPDGEKVGDMLHPKYKIPVISLFGDKRKPSESDLNGIDVLVFDIQDVGLRYYTFIYTMTYCMEAAAQAGITFITLDRPNPLSGSIYSGGCMQTAYASFVGNYEMPVRYGLTIGEVGKYFCEYQKLALDYHVIPLQNYTRDMFHPDTGLIWNMPSPALATYQSTVCYSGGCFAEATNLSEGRGTPKPFQIYGAPFIDMDVIYESMQEAMSVFCYSQQEGSKTNIFAFRKRAFIPQTSKYTGQLCYGLEFEPLDRRADFLPVFLLFLHIIAEHYPEFEVYEDADQRENTMANLTGGMEVARYLSGEMKLEELLGLWDEQQQSFDEKVDSLRIYR